MLTTELEILRFRMDAYPRVFQKVLIFPIKKSSKKKVNNCQASQHISYLYGPPIFSSNQMNS